MNRNERKGFWLFIPRQLKAPVLLIVTTGASEGWWWRSAIALSEAKGGEGEAFQTKKIKVCDEWSEVELSYGVEVQIFSK